MIDLLDADVPMRIYDDPSAPPIANADSLGDLDGRYDPARPDPVQQTRGIDTDDARWATNAVLRHMITSREGATFVRMSEDVFGIAVYGGQYLHEDRHLAEMDDPRGFSEHTWNLSIHGGEDQSLLMEIGIDMFTTLPLSEGSFIYFNTVNRHAVTRRDGTDVVVLIQVDGFGPEDGDRAIARIAEVLAGRPRIGIV